VLLQGKDFEQSMSKNTPVSLIIILIVTLLGAWYLYPSIVFYSKAPAEREEYLEENPGMRKKVINLGLDLQGGMRLVLEIDRSKLDKEAAENAIDRAYTIIENRINALGVAEPSIQKQGRDRLIVELPGLKNEAAAKRVIGSTAQLEFKLLREPGELQRAITVVENAVSGGQVADTAQADTAADEETEEAARRLFGGEDDAEDTVVAEAQEGEQEYESFADKLISLGGAHIGVREEDVPVVKKILERDEVQRALDRAGLGGSVFLWDHTTMSQNNREFRALYYVKSRSELRGDIIKDANASIAQGGMEAGNWIVNLEMNRTGARKFSRVTGVNVNKYLAIVLDSTVYSAPVIRQKIPHGQAQITGSFTAEEARALAIVLEAGALPAPVNIIEERTVGPSLGQDSIEMGVLASLVGFAIVVVFMAIYYKGAGLIANLALLLNLVLVPALMAAMSSAGGGGGGFALTLPGIAGLILIIGMSVDANVIIFERIREELSIGKTVRSAVDAGYSRAFVTIMDANITTLITAAILFFVGTGPIKGFAVTLSFGIVVSMFTALFVTRVIMNMITAGKKATLSI
jgi:protein-export membrane protein SecD